MKKIVLSLAIVSMLFSCNKQEDSVSNEIKQVWKDVLYAFFFQLEEIK